MNVYLAARYGRRAELVEYARDLQSAGHVITSRWLRGGYAFDVDGVLARASEAQWAATGGYSRDVVDFAVADAWDVRAADLVMSFTERGGSHDVPAAAARGGRHVEFGMALALGKRLFVVGPIENVFHAWPAVERFETWPDVLAALEAAA